MIVFDIVIHYLLFVFLLFVIIESPSFEMHEILRDPLFSLVTHYLEGSPLLDTDLFRAKANLALAVFIMGNKFSSKPDEEDAKSILQQFSIQRYVQSTKSISPLFCMQLIRPENRKHVGNQDGDSNETEIIICLNEMKMGVIAKTVTFPGFSTLIFNLLCSFADRDDEEELNSHVISEDNSDEEDTRNDEHWLHEYKKGCDWEIYSTEFSEEYVGRTFLDVSLVLHQKIGIMLFALRIKDLRTIAPAKFLLNPADFVIPPKSNFSVSGFVMAKNKAQSSLVGSFIFSQVDNSNLLMNFVAGVGNNVETALTSPGVVRRTRRDSISNRGEKTQIEVVKHKNKKWHTVIDAQTAIDAEETYNSLEQLQKIEDDRLRSNYYVRDEEALLEQVTIRTSLTAEYPFLSDHLIIVGKSMSNLYDLIMPLRAKYLGKLTHIVILSPNNIPHNVWNRISIFEGIFFVRGSPLEESDIRRAGIFRASQVVVLANVSSGEHTAIEKSNNSALVDADVIFCYKCCKRFNERATVVIEIVREQNISYLDTNTVISSEGNSFKFTPQFAAGVLFTSSMLDTLVCQVLTLLPA